MQEIERSAASVEEAIDSALEELGISEQEADIEVVQEPRTGFLRINSQPAIVRVRRLVEPPEGPIPAAETPTDPEVAAQADVAAAFLEGLAEEMEIEVDVEVSSVDGITYVDMWAVTEDDDDVGLLIGKGGHTLEALQELIRGHMQRERRERCSVLVDVEDYRKRRRSQLVRRAREVARRVQKSGGAEALQPMSAYERKIVHDAVTSVAGVETASEGEEPNRFVVIRKSS